MLIVNGEGLSTFATAHIMFPWWDNGPQRIAYCVAQGMSQEDAEKAEEDHKAQWKRMADALNDGSFFAKVREALGADKDEVTNDRLA
jgi:hypothetical protein